jgi:heat shock protein HslJ
MTVRACGPRRRWAKALLAPLALLAAPALSSPALTPPRPLAFASTLACGDRTATVGSAGHHWVLVVEGQERVLRRTESPSGVRYVAVDDPTTTVWNLGDRARVTVDGRAWPDCTTHAPTAGAPPGPPSFVARGNEPAWRLEVDPRRLRFTPGLDGAVVEVDAPVPTPAGAGRRWDAAAPGGPLTVTAIERVCTDTMSGMPHPLAVSVARDGRIYSGCGGEPATLLRGAEWVVEDIDRRGIIDRSRASLAFLPDGRLVGRASCNPYTARWTLDGERLGIGGVTLGDRVCAPSLMDQEARFVDRLRAISRFEVTPEGALRLLDDGAGSLLARR